MSGVATSATSKSDEHFATGSNASWTISQSWPLDCDLRGVKETWRPGDTRDVKGGMAVYGFKEAHLMCNSCHCLSAVCSYTISANALRSRLNHVDGAQYFCRKFI